MNATTLARTLVNGILATIEPPEQRRSDIVETVFVMIEQDEALLARYRDVVESFGEVSTANQQIADWTRQKVDGQSIRQVPATRTELIESYSEQRFATG